MTKKEKSIVIFSSLNWEEHKQLHHKLAYSLADEGFNVLFINNTGSRSMKFSDVNRLFSWIKTRYRSYHGYNQSSSRIIVNSPFFVPFPFSKIANKVNSIIFRRVISKWMAALRISEVSIISFLPTPPILNTIKKLSPNMTAYFCADDMSRSSKKKLRDKAFEKFFIKNVDQVFTTSNKLFEYAREININTTLCPCGVDTKTFNPKNIYDVNFTDDKAKKVGYIGAISQVFDQDLLLSCAKDCCDTNFYLIGPIYTNIEKIKNVKNIKLLGPIENNLLPSYIQKFDLCIIPYIKNEYTDSVFSCKLNEYLAMGKHVISTNILDHVIFNEKNNNLIDIAESIDSFSNYLRERLKSLDILNSIPNQRRRIKVASSNDWNNIYKNISCKIEEFDRGQDISNPFSWKDEISRIYTTSKKRNAVFFSLLFSLGFFYSPIVPLLGENLVLREDPRNVDAIVVMSGTGEGGYRNDSFQRRAIDSVNFYNNGLTKKIILSSGKEQTISEVELMKLFIKSRGIPDSAIETINSYPSSTYEAVKIISDHLKNREYKNIILITSPYHSKRLSLTWKKNNHDMNILFPEVIDTPQKGLYWGMEIDKIKLIFYEYIAIVYYWLKGWL